MPIDAILRNSVIDEATRSWDKFGPYTSSHEAYGVIAEEVAELLDAIRGNDMDAIRKEAIQVAAVAYKLACDVDDPDFRGRSGA